MGEIVDISLPLDDQFGMWTPGGFKRDMQFDLEVLKDFDSEEGAGQIVRGLHMRLHAGTHVDAEEHFVKGGKQVHELPLETFYGDAVIADLTPIDEDSPITADAIEAAVGDELRPGDRLLLRTDWSKHYGEDGWVDRSPYPEPGAVDWCVDRRISLLGIDFSHAKDAPDSPSLYYLSETLCQAGIVIMPYLRDLDRVKSKRATLVCFPLKIIGAESSPVRAIVLEGDPPYAGVSA
jgi:arylformamidase